MEQPDSAAPANIILAETSDVASLLGRNCRARRARFKMSQGELSLRTGISASRLSLIENGRANTTLEIMDAIARALQCSVAALLSHPQLRAPSTDDRLAGICPVHSNPSCPDRQSVVQGKSVPVSVTLGGG